MGMWITVDGVRRWPVQQVTALGNFRLARACKEVGLTPDRLGAVLGSEDDRPDDPDAAIDRLTAMAVVVYAARVLAGEPVRSVEEANDFPADAWDFEDDDPEPEPEPDPTEVAGTGDDPTS